ncbi:RCC1/BLIP-II [Lactarius deliciosus]|nr:RCC1/BLIP-II [Lactarius deliciosus]
MPPRSRSQASIDAPKPRAPSRASSRTALASKARSSQTEKASTTRSRTQPKPPPSPDTSQSQSPPSLKRSRSAATLKEVNGINDVAKPLKKTKTVAVVAQQPKRTRKTPSETELPINAIPPFPAKVNPPAQIFVWGTGNFGQFGMGPSYLDEVSKPTRNTWVEEKMAQGVFGSGPGSGIVGVAAGGLHSLLIDENGTVWSCGVNDDAALGRITKDVPDPNTPGQFLNVDLLTTFPHPLQTLVDDSFRALKIAAGDKLRVWGSFRANEGALGFSTGLTHQFVPKAALPNERCVNVATGNNHLVVLTVTGSIYSWGAGEQGQLGRKILERRKIHGTNPERVVLGARGRRASTEDGAVWGWGLNSAGQTGTGINTSDTDSIVQTPRRVLGLDGIQIVEIVGGDLHTLFLSADGRVFACGRSDSAQLGLALDHPAMVGIADQERVQTPTVVVRRAGGSWAAVNVSCGGQHSLGLFRKRVT